MKNKICIEGKSIYDGNETREIPIEKICEVFGLDEKSVKFSVGNDKEDAEFFVEPNLGYGMLVRGYVGNSQGKDYYKLAAVLFNDNRPGFYTQVYPGLFEAADESEKRLCEKGIPMVVVNQQKRERGDFSDKVVYYDNDFAVAKKFGSRLNLNANTIKEYGGK